MKERGKTIMESIDQGTPMGKLLGGWTGNQAEVDKAVQSKLSDKSLTCDAFDASLKIAKHRQDIHTQRYGQTTFDRRSVGKRCKAYKVVSAASEKAMKFVKGCKCKFFDFNYVDMYALEPIKMAVGRAGSYFEVRVVLEGSVEWPVFSRFTTCFLNGMRTLLGREVVVDKICLGKPCSSIWIQFRFAKKAKLAKKCR